LPKEWKSLDDFYANVFVGLSAAFSPNSGCAPFYVHSLYREQDVFLALADSFYVVATAK
jgi:hypothetical protein